MAASSRSLIKKGGQGFAGACSAREFYLTKSQLATNSKLLLSHSKLAGFSSAANHTIASRPISISGYWFSGAKVCKVTVQLLDRRPHGCCQLAESLDPETTGHEIAPAVDNCPIVVIKHVVATVLLDFANRMWPCHAIARALSHHPKVLVTNPEAVRLTSPHPLLLRLHPGLPVPL